jgi:hypothetical protein
VRTLLKASRNYKNEPRQYNQNEKFINQIATAVSTGRLFSGMRCGDDAFGMRGW